MNSMRAPIVTLGTVQAPTVESIRESLDVQGGGEADARCQSMERAPGMGASRICWMVPVKLSWVAELLCAGQRVSLSLEQTKVTGAESIGAAAAPGRYIPRNAVSPADGGSIPLTGAHFGPAQLEQQTRDTRKLHPFGNCIRFQHCFGPAFEVSADLNSSGNGGRPVAPAFGSGPKGRT